MNPGPNDVGPAARAYAENGWALIEFPRGTKGPNTHGWNLPKNQTTDPDEAELFTQNIGLCHAASGTCCVDIDDRAQAAPWLLRHGIDLEALRTAPDHVGFTSGRPGRGKLLYRLPAGVAPLPSKRPTDSGLELRCATANGLTVQDVLPPSIHPITKQPYVWEYGDELTGHWSVLPELPPEILALWRSLMSAPAPARQAPQGVEADRIRGMLSRLDPDLDYNEWVKVGMALHHEAEGEDWGLALWDEWSAKGSKYQGDDSLAPHWRSFGSNRGRAVTIQSIIGMAGGVNPDDFEDLTRSESADSHSLPASDQRLRAMPWDEFMQGPEPEYLIENLIGKGSLSMVYGASTTGKTYLAVAFAVAVAAGKQWTGRDVEGGNVIYVVNEGVSGLRLRMRAAAELQEVDEAIVRERLSFISDVPNLLSGADVGRVISEVRLKKATLVVIDTLSHSIAGADENAAAEMSSVTKRCTQIIRETGVTVLLVHHAGKDPTRGARGSTVIKAAVDNEICVTREEGEDVSYVKVTKMKDGEGAGETFRMTFTTFEFGLNERRKPRLGFGVKLEALGRLSTQSSLPKCKKLGANQQAVYDAVQDLAGVSNELVLASDVIARCVRNSSAPPAEKRDQREANFSRALRALCLDGGRLVSEGQQVRIR